MTPAPGTQSGADGRAERRADRADGARAQRRAPSPPRRRRAAAHPRPRPRRRSTPVAPWAPSSPTTPAPAPGSPSCAPGRLRPRPRGARRDRRPRGDGTRRGHLRARRPSAAAPVAFNLDCDARDTTRMAARRAAHIGRDAQSGVSCAADVDRGSASVLKPAADGFAPSGASRHGVAFTISSRGCDAALSRRGRGRPGRPLRARRSPRRPQPRPRAAAPRRRDHRRARASTARDDDRCDDDGWIVRVRASVLSRHLLVAVSVAGARRRSRPQRERAGR